MIAYHFALSYIEEMKQQFAFMYNNRMNTKDNEISKRINNPEKVIFYIFV